MDLLNLSYKKYFLKNGLEVILHTDNSLPVVSVNIWYKVGSANEVKGKTGLAHLFEHMMFQGSENVPKEHHFKFIQEAGGTLNGSTSNDRTNYYEKVPSNFLELVLWLESDRMGRWLTALNQEKLTNQKDVVKNERLERYDNQPYGLAWELIVKNFYPQSHPYSWPTIGFLKDIESYTIDDVKNFFQTYYSPSNATLVIAGDIKEEETISLVEKYFASIPSTSNDKKEIQFQEIKLNEKIVIEHKDNVQLERLYLAWPSVKIYDEKDAHFEVLADIVSGSKNSRLNKKLVFDDQISQDVVSFQYSGKYGGSFILISTARPTASIEEIRDKIIDELKIIAENGPTENELEKTKNGIKSSFISSLQNIDVIADHLNHYNFYLGDPNSFRGDLERYNKVNANDVKSCANFLLNNNYLQLNIIPKQEK